MAEETKIEWCDHTFNPWIGCTKVSPGCANCYAAAQDKFRKWTPEGWGKGRPRKRTSVLTWRQPVFWNRKAEAAGVRRRVFCASLADWLDDEVPLDWLWDLIGLIKETPNLEWLLLTKRPKNFETRMGNVTYRASDLHDDFVFDWLCGRPPGNVRIGITVEDQPRWEERRDDFLDIPAAGRFLSCEPLLGPVDLTGYITLRSWVICGGESGPQARPMHPDWARSLRDQCQAEGVPFFMKQLGGRGSNHRGKLEDFPEDLRVREFPKP